MIKNKPLLNPRHWPTSMTTCKCCGGEIIYLEYTDATKKVKRSVPLYHSGHCREVKRVDRARINVKDYRHRRAAMTGRMR